MIIEELQKNYYNKFKELFYDYFVEIGQNLTKEIVDTKIVDECILQEYEKSIIYIDVIKEMDIVGFIIYQIDNEKSDWNKRPGFGFIREFYIEPKHRRQGYGNQLLKNAELCLKRLGIEYVYLTSDEKEYVKDFYLHNGYVDEAVRDNISKLSYFIKKIQI